MLAQEADAEGIGERRPIADSNRLRGGRLAQLLAHAVRLARYKFDCGCHKQHASSAEGQRDSSSPLRRQGSVTGGYMYSLGLRASGTLLVAACVLAGCATQQAQDKAAGSMNSSHPAITEPGASPAMQGGPTVVDARPSNDKQYEMHSLWITSCDYGVFTLAEKNGTKSRVEVLHDDLSAIPGDPWAGHTVTVTHYAAYLNMKRALKHQVYSMNTGLIPMAMAQMGETCSETEMHGGWYAGADLKTTEPPIVIEIVATVDGKEHRTRSVYSPQTAITPKLKKPSDDTQLAEAVAKANREFIASLRNVVSTSPMRSPPDSQAAPTSMPVTAAQTMSSTPNMLGKAQQVASQLGCGDVRATGDTTFAAQCGGHGVAIDCDESRCRPVHTINE